MMRTEFPELDPLRVSVPQAVRERQMAAIADALAGSSEPVPMRLRRRLSMWLAALLAAGVPTVAVAAESAAPGDALYPVKLATESVRAVFDSGLPAEHRVQELEQMATDNPDSPEIERQVERVENALADLDRTDLVMRFERAVDLVREHRSRSAAEVEPAPVDRRRDVTDPPGFDARPDRHAPDRDTPEGTSSTSTAPTDQRTDRTIADTTTTSGADGRTPTTRPEEPAPSDRPAPTDGPRRDG